MRATAILLVVGLVLVNSLSREVIGAPQSDYLIVPGQRVGQWELGRPLEAYQWGRPRWSWKTEVNGFPLVDGYNFLPTPSGPSLDIRICKGDPRVFQIAVVRVITLPPQSEVETLQYKTAQGIGIGTDEADVIRLLGPPSRAPSEWIARHGTSEFRAVTYEYPGLVFLINRGNRKVFGLGAMIPNGWSECELAVLGGRAATQRQDLTSPGPLGVPLPRNLRVISPASDIPGRYASISGQWVGVNKYGNPHVLVVEEILLGPPRAIVVSSWGGRSPVWRRYVGRFTAEELILSVTGRGSPCSEACRVFWKYKLINQESLQARYDENEPEHSYAFLMSRPRN